MTDIYCGIDIGTTNLKVLLLDETAKPLWVKSVPAPHLSDGLGVVTDARALLRFIEDLVIEGWRQVGKGRKIAAIASGGIGEDGVGTDQNLQPLGHAIQWNDRRGERYAQALARSNHGRRYPAILLDFSSTAGKWEWLRKHRPEELAGAQHWITMTDYPAAAWSGVPFMSATLAPRTGCYDVFTRSWIDSHLQHSGAPPVPKLLEAGDIVGTLRHGRLLEAGAATANTLVVAGGHDHPVAASAIRRIDKNARIDSMGTADATYGETTALAADHNLEGLYVTLPISGAKGAAVIGMTEFSVTLAEAFGDAGTIHKRLLDTRLLSDIDAGLRAILETMALQTRHYFAAMTRAGVPAAPVYATGGWARCPALMQLRANVFGETITVVDEPELVALGAALFAAQGADKELEFGATEKCHVVMPSTQQ